MVDIVYSELDSRLALDGQGDIAVVTNAEAVKASVRNILTIFKGERVMLASFASRLRAMVFEPNNKSLEGFMAEEIKTVIETWDDRPQVQVVEFQRDPERGEIILGIKFVIVGYADIFTIEERI